MMVAAWENGLDGSLVPGMTPSEAHGMFERLRVQTVHRAAELDRMAWLIGSYNTTATNAPKKYPRKPRNADRILHTVIKREPMTDEEMQAVAKSIARRWNEQCRQ